MISRHAIFGCGHNVEQGLSPEAEGFGAPTNHLLGRISEAG